MVMKRYIKHFEWFIQIVIALSLMAFALETVPNLSRTIQHILYLGEIGFVIVFIVEYIIRFGFNKFSYLFSFFGVVDLIAIVPILAMLNPKFFLLRYLRLLRILKFLRYVNTLRNIGIAINNVRKELFMYIVVNFCILYTFAVIMYYVEGPVQSSKFGSIMDSLWWAVVTLTTIGYGDVVPVTPLGKFITGLIALLGIGIITIPTGLIASTLVRSKMKEKKCKIQIDPHLETLTDDGDIIIDENENPEIEEEGKIGGMEEI
jgi:voltage-gated potassium channel